MPRSHGNRLPTGTMGRVDGRACAAGERLGSRGPATQGSQDTLRRARLHPPCRGPRPGRRRRARRYRGARRSPKKTGASNHFYRKYGRRACRTPVSGSASSSSGVLSSRRSRASRMGPAGRPAVRRAWTFGCRILLAMRGGFAGIRVREACRCSAPSLRTKRAVRLRSEIPLRRTQPVSFAALPKPAIAPPGPRFMMASSSRSRRRSRGQPRPSSSPLQSGSMPNDTATASLTETTLMRVLRSQFARNSGAAKTLGTTSIVPGGRALRF